MSKPVIITGCGRSGTHWIGALMVEVFGYPAAAFEPPHWKGIGTVIVDSRLRHHADKFRSEGHRLVHLVRDGRDVVRSLHQWYRTHEWLERRNHDGTYGSFHESHGVPFEECCHEWAHAVDLMRDAHTLRIEDLSRPGVRDAQDEYALPHWTEWDDEKRKVFWDICGEQMERMGYEGE